MRVPGALVDEPDNGLVVDAVYFVVRVLRNSTRGFRAPMVSSEAGPEARGLAQHAIRQIEGDEGTDIALLDEATAEAYIAALEQLQRERAVSGTGGETADAQRILDEMRSSER